MVSNTHTIQADALSKLNGIDHAFFTRQHGASKGIYAQRNIGLGSDDERAAVLDNRARCAADLGVDADKLATPYQIHSNKVVTIDEVWPAGEGPKADGLVTKTPGIMIGIATADCGPVLFADEKAGVIGAAHAGWRGATGGILEATLEAMENLGAKRDAITAVLGPTIAQASYEVGPEFVETLKELRESNADYLKPSEREAHALFDLPRYIIDRLNENHIRKAIDLGLDTYADAARFYSFRRTTHRGEADYGRLLSAIALSNGRGL